MRTQLDLFYGEARNTLSSPIAAPANGSRNPAGAHRILASRRRAAAAPRRRRVPSTATPRQAVADSQMFALHFLTTGFLWLLVSWVASPTGTTLLALESFPLSI